MNKILPCRKSSPRITQLICAGGKNVPASFPHWTEHSQPPCICPVWMRTGVFLTDGFFFLFSLVRNEVSCASLISSDMMGSSRRMQFSASVTREKAQQPNGFCVWSCQLSLFRAYYNSSSHRAGLARARERSLIVRYFIPASWVNFEVCLSQGCLS